MPPAGSPCLPFSCDLFPTLAKNVGGTVRLLSPGTFAPASSHLRHKLLLDKPLDQVLICRMAAGAQSASHFINSIVEVVLLVKGFIPQHTFCYSSYQVTVIVHRTLRTIATRRDMPLTFGNNRTFTVPFIARHVVSQRGRLLQEEGLRQSYYY